MVAALQLSRNAQHVYYLEANKCLLRQLLVLITWLSISTT